MVRAEEKKENNLFCCRRPLCANVVVSVSRKEMAGYLSLSAPEIETSCSALYFDLLLDNRKLMWNCFLFLFSAVAFPSQLREICRKMRLDKKGISTFIKLLRETL